jgi:hypothetical protein
MLLLRLDYRTKSQDKQGKTGARHESIEFAAFSLVTHPEDSIGGGPGAYFVKEMRILPGGIGLTLAQ